MEALMDDDVAFALKLFRERPKSWSSTHNIALCLQMLQQYQDALAVFKEAIVCTQNPQEQAQSTVCMANCLRYMLLFDEHLEMLEVATSFSETWPQTYFLMSANHVRTNRLEDAALCLFKGYHYAMQLDAEDTDNFVLAYAASATAKTYRKGAASLLDLLYADFDRPQHFKILHQVSCAAFGINANCTDIQPGICFVSEHFHAGSIGSNFMPLLQGLLRLGVGPLHLWAVGHLQQDDDVTRKFKGLPGVTWWQNRPPNMKLAICLDGHTGTREALRCLAHRLAPVQLDYLGYPFTTGSPCIDGKIVDIVTDPVDQQNMYTETLIRLPCAMWVWQPTPGSKPSSNGIALCHVLVTQNFKKLRPAFLQCCATLLDRNPHLHIHFRCTLRPDSKAVFNRWIKPFFTPHHKIHFEDTVPAEDLIHNLGTFHFALDTFPYNGTVTTMECLYAGLPVISVSQDFHRSRTGLSIMTACGLANDLCITSAEGMLHRAESMGRQTSEEAVQAHQHVMRSMQASSLMNPECLSAHMMTVFNGVIS